MDNLMFIGASPKTIGALVKALLSVLENKPKNDQVTLQKALDVLLKGTHVENTTVRDCTFTGGS